MPEPQVHLADTAYRHLGLALAETSFEAFGRKARGKVRDTYRTDDGRLIIVTTDRISAFDHVLPQPIPFKGQVLNQLAAHFFEATEAEFPNHVLSIPDPNVTIGIACEPVPVEFVVRGYLAGHARRVYEAGGRALCGAVLPEGLRAEGPLPQPILTPTTKADEGHDEDISPHEILERGLLGKDTFEHLADTALRLFARGSELAAERGLILADTKYEFGLAPDGRYLLIDEIHTPDSSRYFHAEGYEERLARGEPQRQLSKEFVREWLMARGFRGLEGQRTPDLPDDFRVEVALRYAELYEAVTGLHFEPDTHPEPERRIHEALGGLIT